MSAMTITILAAGATLTVAAGLSIADGNTETTFKQAAMAAELQDVARYATGDYMFTGNLEETIANSVDAFGAYNDPAGPRLGTVTTGPDTITYKTDGVCWRLTLTEKNQATRLLTHRIDPCDGQTPLDPIDASTAPTN